MNTDQSGKDFIASFEKKRYEAYKDNKGHSIGIGHYIVLPAEGWMLSATLNDQKVYEIFNKDILQVDVELSKVVPVPLNQNQWNALADVLFNVGLTKLLKSGMLEDITNINKWFSLDKGIASIHERRLQDFQLFNRTMI